MSVWKHQEIRSQVARQKPRVKNYPSPPTIAPLPDLRPVPCDIFFIARRLSFFCAMVLLFLLLSPPAFALTGRVINKTLNRPETGVAVSYIQHAGADVVVLRDTTDAEGRFALNLPSDPASDPPPMLMARYHNIDYPGNPAPAAGEIEIPVFELSNADTAISIVSHHILVNTQNRDVTYILIPQNRSDRTYVSDGDHGHGLELTLPEGVTDVLRAPQGVHLHGSTLVDPRPIIPGNSQTFFSFALPASNKLVHHITYPTASLDILVQPADAKVSATGLQDQGVVHFGQDTFRRFAAVDLLPGAHIGLTLETDDLFSQETLIWALAALALVFGIAAVWIARRPRSAAPVRNSGQHRRTALLEQIADLDERFKQGKIAEADYRARRDALMAEVSELSPDRQRLLEQIADLDERFEQGKIAEADYRARRDDLKARASALLQQG